jgi:hypothetical protein
VAGGNCVMRSLIIFMLGSMGKLWKARQTVV